MGEVTAYSPYIYPVSITRRPIHNMLICSEVFHVLPVITHVSNLLLTRLYVSCLPSDRIMSLQALLEKEHLNKNSDSSSTPEFSCKHFNSWVGLHNKSAGLSMLSVIGSVEK